MGRPKVGVRVPWHTYLSRTGTLPAQGQQATGPPKQVKTPTASVVQPGLQRLQGQVKTEPNCSSGLGTLPSQQATASAVPRHSSGSVEPNENQVSGLERPTKTQGRTVQVKTEPNGSRAIGIAEKRSLQTPISATTSSILPGTEGLEATAPGMWPSMGPALEEHNCSPRGRITLFEEMQEFNRELEKTEQNRIPASASTLTTAVVKVEEGVGAGTCSVMPSTAGGSQGVGASKKQEGERKTSIVGRKPRAKRLKFSVEDLESDSHLLLKDKAIKLGVSMSAFKNHRRKKGLGRWPGRAVRARMNK